MQGKAMTTQTEALKLALEALKTAQNNLAPSKSSAHAFGDGELWDKYAESITALEALAQPEQEPVAWTDENVIAWCLARGVKAAEGITPPQRTWVGLTSDEISAINQRCLKADEPIYSAVRIAEAKLKEKNNEKGG